MVLREKYNSLDCSIGLERFPASSFDIRTYTGDATLSLPHHLPSYQYTTPYSTPSSPFNFASLNACSCILLSMLCAQYVADLIAFPNLSPPQSALKPTPL